MSLDLIPLEDAVKLTPYGNVKTLRRAIKSKKLKAVQPAGKGGRVFVTLAALNAWLSGGFSVSSPSPVAARPFARDRYA